MVATAGSKTSNVFHPYIYEAFHTFVAHKKKLNINLYYAYDILDEELKNLLFYPVTNKYHVHEIDGWITSDCDENLLKPILFRTFKNVKEVLIDGENGKRGNHQFSLLSLLKLIQSTSISRITIKVYETALTKLSTSPIFLSIQEQYKAKQFDIKGIGEELLIFNDRFYKESEKIKACYLLEKQLSLLRKSKKLFNAEEVCAEAQFKNNSCYWEEVDLGKSDHGSSRSEVTYIDKVINKLYEKRIDEDVILRLVNHLKDEDYDSDSFYLDSRRYSNISQCLELRQDQFIVIMVAQELCAFACLEIGTHELIEREKIRTAIELTLLDNNGSANRDKIKNKLRENKGFSRALILEYDFTEPNSAKGVWSYMGLYWSIWKVNGITSRIATSRYIP